MKNQQFYLFDIGDLNSEMIEIVSAVLSSNEHLIGITEIEGGSMFCFDSDTGRATGFKMIKDFVENADVNFYEKDIENWNKIWEENFEPVVIGDYCAIIAPHHEFDDQVKHCITINPEMSFGTGHHETTSMMISYMEDLDVNDKSVLDFGCGTGVLAILAELEGAMVIDAIDYDELCYDSTMDNANRNGCGRLQVQLGDISKVTKQYDLILANVNKRVLLSDCKSLCDALCAEGTLLLSGLLNENEEEILAAYGEYVDHLETKSKGDWLAIRFEATS